MRRFQILNVTLRVVLLLFIAGCATKTATTQTAKPDMSTPPAVKVSTIQKISFTEEQNYTRIQIEGSEPIAPPFYKLLSDPLRITIDVPNIDLKQISSPLRIENGTIGDVLTTQYDDKGRIEIGLLQMTNYNISNEEKDLIIDVEKVKKVEEPKEAKKEETILKETKVEAPAPEPKKEESPLAPPPLSKAKKVVNVSFEERKDFVVFNILADGKIENFNAFKLDSPPRLVLDIWGVESRKSSFKVKNPLIKGVRFGHYPDKLRLVFDSPKAQLPPYQVNRIDDKLMVSLGNIPQPSEPQIYVPEKSGKENFIDIKEKNKAIQTKASVTSEIKKEERAEAAREAVKKKDEIKKEEKPAPELEIKAEKTTPLLRAQEKANTEGEKRVFEGTPQKVYSRKKLSLDFKDADIKNILRLIAEVSDLNIIVADEVTGKITMRLVDVPWDQALEIILQSKNLGQRRDGNVVRIAPADALRKEEQARYEEQRSKEKMEPTVNELIPVNYASAKDIMSQVKGILRSERGDVKVDERTNTLIVKDIPNNISAIRNLVKFLDTKTPLVLIEARIIEANLSFQRELGVQWGMLMGGGKATVGGGTTGSALGSVVNRVVDLAANPRAGLGGGGVGAAGVLAAVFSRGTIQEIDVTLSAHENQGNAKIISSPKIATLDNKEASIEQGLRIPYLKLTTEGTVTTDFIDANIKLTVRPHVTNDGTIKLELKVKKDAPDQSIVVQGVPSIDKKEAISEVLIKDGGVVAIAGIYSISKNDQAEGVPLFNKIPLLGWLFKRENKEDTRKDLLIFISPRIMKDEV